MIGYTDPMTCPDDYITLKIQFTVADATRRTGSGLLPSYQGKTGTRLSLIPLRTRQWLARVSGIQEDNPLHASANGKVQTIYLDQSVFAYSGNSVGSLSGKRGPNLYSSWSSCVSFPLATVRRPLNQPSSPTT